MSELTESFVQLGPFDQIPVNRLSPATTSVLDRERFLASFDSSRISTDLLGRIPSEGWRKIRDGGGRDVWAAPSDGRWWLAHTVPRDGATLLAIAPFPVSAIPPRSVRRKGLELKPAEDVVNWRSDEHAALHFDYLLTNTSSDSWINRGDDKSTLAICPRHLSCGFHVFGIGNELPDLDPGETVLVTGTLSARLSPGTHRISADLVDLALRARSEVLLTLL